MTNPLVLPFRECSAGPNLPSQPLRLSALAIRMAVVVLLTLIASAARMEARAEPHGAKSAAQVFETPELAFNALIASVRAGATDGLLAVLGPNAKPIINSGDPTADQNARERFIEAFDQSHKSEPLGEERLVLMIGKDDFPFPIPLLRTKAGWQFDAEAGKEEILDRRIGANELRAIESMHAYVQAQREYASADRDGKGVQYAQRLLSSEGTRDGLYWPSAASEEESPLGPLIASARSEGYAARAGSPQPYHGYHYRILKAQGPNALGGAIEYVAGDRMIGGFALVAFPAAYGNSGVMTFIVNHDGVVHQKDLGPATAKLGASMTRFDPDGSWTKVSSP